LEFLPDSPEIREAIWISDIALQRTQFGIELPGPGASDDDVTDYIAELANDDNGGVGIPISRGSTIDTLVSGFGSNAWKVEDWRNSLGFIASNVDLTILSGSVETTFEVLEGRFDLTEIEQAVRNDETWKEQLEQESRKGLDYYTWAEDYVSSLEGRSGVRPTGRGGRMHATSEAVFWTHGTGEMHDLVDVATDQNLSLARDEDFRLLANAMDEEGVYAGFLSDVTQNVEDQLFDFVEGFGITPEQYETLANRFGSLALDPFEAVGVGVSSDGSHYFVVISLAYDDERSAEDNVHAAERMFIDGFNLQRDRRWSEDFRNPEVTVNGRILIATATMDNPATWVRMINDQHLMFFHK
jgi:hypothetical protein